MDAIINITAKNLTQIDKAINTLNHLRSAVFSAAIKVEKTSDKKTAAQKLYESDKQTADTVSFAEFYSLVTNTLKDF